MTRSRLCLGEFEDSDSTCLTGNTDYSRRTDAAAENLPVQANHDIRVHEAENDKVCLADSIGRYCVVRLERFGSGRVAHRRDYSCQPNNAS